MKDGNDHGSEGK